MSTELISFIILVLVMEITPGPNMAHLAIISASQGRLAGFSAVAGISFGLAISALIAFLSVSTVFEAPLFYKAVSAAGIIYIIWLSISTWHGKEKILIEKQEVFYRYFTRGLITNILNPKAFLFFIIVTPKFSESADDKLIMNLALSSFSVIVATVIHSLIVLLSGAFEKYFASGKNIALTRKINSVILFLIAIWLGFSAF